MLTLGNSQAIPVRPFMQPRGPTPIQMTNHTMFLLVLSAPLCRTSQLDVLMY
jgi:hypothetical protein